MKKQLLTIALLSAVAGLIGCAKGDDNGQAQAPGHNYCMPNQGGYCQPGYGVNPNYPQVYQGPLAEGRLRILNEDSFKRLMSDYGLCRTGWSAGGTSECNNYSKNGGQAYITNFNGQTAQVSLQVGPYSLWGHMSQGLYYVMNYNMQIFGINNNQGFELRTTGMPAHQGAYGQPGHPGLPGFPGTGMWNASLSIRVEQGHINNNTFEAVYYYRGEAVASTTFYNRGQVAIPYSGQTYTQPTPAQQNPNQVYMPNQGVRY